MIKKVYYLNFLLLLLCTQLQAQTYTPTQVVKGKIIDADSKSPLFAASVALFKDSILIGGATTNDDGAFKISNIPVGKYRLKATSIGYLPYTNRTLEVTSAKETFVNIELTESTVTMQEVVITADGGVKYAVNNEMATVSTRTFSIAESNRYAGSRGEPGRMASNFAGVNGSNDSRNDIVVRGNSPSGIVWRLEGVDIPNPNHFTINGNTGGAVSILNNKSLANSDFLTGAFPAEYGNGLAGVFDVKMRNGNNEKRETSAQVGFLGVEVASEGPLSRKSGASYLFTYRYSTFSLFQLLNINIGTDAVPRYQDASFKLNFPLKKGFNLSAFGIGGLSGIDIISSNKKAITNNIYGDKGVDQYFGSDMGVLGLTLTKQHKNSAYSKFIVATSGYHSHAAHNNVLRDTITQEVLLTPAKMRGVLDEVKTYVNYYYNKKFTAKLSLKAGVTNTYSQLNYFDSIINKKTNKFFNRTLYNGNNVLTQPFAQVKYKFNNNIQLNAGLHGQYSNINNNSYAIEPRIGVAWNINEKNTLSLGSGFHSQLQPFYVYYSLLDSNKTGSTTFYNTNLSMTKAKHLVLSYDYSISAASRLKVEVYSQWLSGIPVTTNASSFSTLNQGANLNRGYTDTLTNGGTGTNKGIELTLEQFFSRSFFFLITGSYYDSKYRGSDGILRNSDFNGKYAANILAGKEFKIKDKNYLNIGAKLTLAGGKRYTPVNVSASNAIEDIVEIDALRNTKQFYDYTRFDIRLAYKINSKRTTTEIALDLVNILGIKNPLGLTYAYDPANPKADPIKTEYQLGRLPLFYIKVDF
jgi:hypothetical protein